MDGLRPDRLFRGPGKDRLNVNASATDGSGRDDAVIGFAPGLGTWKWMNDSTWVALHGLSPEVMVSGNLDGL